MVAGGGGVDTDMQPPVSPLTQPVSPLTPGVNPAPGGDLSMDGTPVSASALERSISTASSNGDARTGSADLGLMVQLSVSDNASLNSVDSGDGVANQTELVNVSAVGDDALSPRLPNNNNDTTFNSSISSNPPQTPNTGVYVCVCVCVCVCVRERERERERDWLMILNV